MPARKLTRYKRPGTIRPDTQSNLLNTSSYFNKDDFQHMWRKDIKHTKNAYTRQNKASDKPALAYYYTCTRIHTEQIVTGSSVHPSTNVCVWHLSKDERFCWQLSFSLPPQMYRKRTSTGYDPSHDSVEKGRPFWYSAKVQHARQLPEGYQVINRRTKSARPYTGTTHRAGVAWPDRPDKHQGVNCV